MVLDKDTLYMKTIAFDEIYNFLVCTYILGLDQGRQIMFRMLR